MLSDPWERLIIMYCLREKAEDNNRISITLNKQKMMMNMHSQVESYNRISISL